MNIKQANTLAVASNSDVRFYNNGFVAAIETHSLEGFVFYRCRVSCPEGSSCEWAKIHAWLSDKRPLVQGNAFGASVVTFEVTLADNLNDTWHCVSEFLSFFSID